MIPLGVLASARVAATAAGVTLTHLGTKLANLYSFGTSYTYTGCPLGTTGTERTLIILHAFHTTNGSSSTSITVAGTAATMDATAPWPGGAAIGHVTIPAGAPSTGDITVTLSSANNTFSALFVYLASGPVSVAGSATDGTSPLSVSVTTASGHAVVGIASTSNTDATDWTWSGLTKDQEVAAPSATTAIGTGTGAALTVSAGGPAASYPSLATVAYTAA